MSSTHTSEQVFYEITGRYVVGNRSVPIEGMIGINSDKGIVGVIEDGYLPLREITIHGELKEKNGMPQFSCVVPSSKGETYGVIAEKKVGDASVEGHYVGSLFIVGSREGLVPKLEEQSAALLPLVGKFELSMARSPDPNAELDN